MDDKQDTTKKPAVQPRVSPISGVAPPVEHQWKKGQSGNPKGRQTAGAYVSEWFNALYDVSEAEIERIAKDKSAPAAKRAAAIQWLDIIAGAADLSDYEAYVDGRESLSDLKKRGVTARALKKARETRRSGDWGEETKREVELSDRGASALDRIMDRTAGKPQQAIDVTSGGESIRPILVAPGQLNLVDWQQQVVQIQQGTPDALSAPEDETKSGDDMPKRT